jgi:glycosyltransferase involved in cell wall biosynthesis
MKITVIVCTYNRCESLAKALDSLGASEVDKSVEWEVLVVDNNSKDQTHEVVKQFSDRFPGRFRYVFEAQQGLCHARNAGIRESLGEILAFTDDDVSVDPAWLENLTGALRGGEWAGTGGRILPVWPGPAPQWLPTEGQHALAPLAVFDLGENTCELSEAPFGANMAYRKVMFEKYGGFRTDLGRVGNNLMSGEDTEFGIRLLSAGERLRYEPSAVVHHPVTEDRMKKGYFLRWWFDNGRGGIRQFGVRPQTKYYLSGIPLYLFRRLAVWSLRWLTAMDSHWRFEYKIKVWIIRGQITECSRIRSRLIDRDSSAMPERDPLGTAVIKSGASCDKPYSL